MPETNESCEQCRQPFVHDCTMCGQPYCRNCEEYDYCSRCKYFEVFQSREYGQCLKASREFGSGEVVFSEFPVVMGPKLPLEHGCVPCVGCCKSVFEVKISYCTECLWPACRFDCPHLKNNRSHGLECKILKAQKAQFSKTALRDFRFELLLPLRILLIQSNIDHLLKHTETNEDAVSNNDIEETILKTIEIYEEQSGVTILQNKSKELLTKIVNFLKTKPFHLDGVQIVYKTLGLVGQSCIANTFQLVAVNNNFKLTIVASAPISKDTPLTLSFVDLYQGTQERLTQLETKNLSCSCSRCRDPTEFGTFFSALRCLGTRTEPCGGIQLPVEPTKSDTMWVCDKCNIELPNDQMIKFVQHLGGEVIKVLYRKSTVDDLEELLAKLFMFLHPNHFYVCQVKMALVKGYSTDLFTTKIDLCKSLIDIFGKLKSGGVVLGELHHELFESKFATAVKNGGDATELKQLVEVMKNNVEAKFDEAFLKLVTEDDNKLNEWLTKTHST